MHFVKGKESNFVLAGNKGKNRTKMNPKCMYAKRKFGSLWNRNTRKRILGVVRTVYELK